MPGRYIVHVQRDGFTPIEVPELELNVNDTVAIRVQMKVSGLGESVSVLPEPPRINTSPGVSTVIDRQRMEALPMLNRSTLALAEMVPGVVGRDAAAGRIGSAFGADDFRRSAAVPIRSTCSSTARSSRPRCSIPCRTCRRRIPSRSSRC